MTVVEPWNRIVAYWRKSGIPIRPGASPEAMESFQRTHGVILPADVRAYLSSVDGTGDMEMDNETVRFWPLSEVVPVHQCLDERGGVVYPDRFAYPDCFVFADYCVNAWLYAVRLTADPDQPAPVCRVTDSNPPGEKSWPSFREFMERYASDPSSIL